MEIPAYRQPDPESFLVQPDTVGALLEAIDAKADNTEPSRFGAVYDGILDGEPVKFVISQFPMELGLYGGAVGKIESTPTVVTTEGRDPELLTTRYLFYPREDGSVEIEKWLPYDTERLLKEKDASEMSWSEFDDLLESKRAEIRAEEKALGLSVVDEQEARELLKAVQESTENPEVRKRMKGERRQAAKARKELEREFGLTSGSRVETVGLRVADFVRKWIR